MGDWWNPFDWGKDERKPEERLITKVVEDPIKTAVSKPLSEYLSKQIGKGLPRYEGKLTEPLENIYTGYQEFLSKDPGEWFDEAIAGPETKRFKEEYLPILREGWAGSLRGSGKFREEEAGISKFSEYLVGERARQLPEITGKQMGVASVIKGFKDQDYQTEFREWIRTRPEYNPAIEQSLKFLSVSSGRDTISAMDPAQEGWFADLLGMGLQAGATYFGSKAIAAALPAVAACWVAAEIFGGWYEPKTQAARYYIKNMAPSWFRNFYLRHGMEIAKFISNKPMLKMLLRPLFEYFALRGGEFSWQCSS